MARVDFLKRRAESFFRNGKGLIKDKEYSLAAFNFGQTAQLYLKYYLFLRLRDFPKTHSLNELLTDLSEVYQKEESINKFKEKNASIIGDLEQAYISSRYLPVDFYLPQVKNMEKFVKELKKILERL